jgi:flagellar protein FliL
MTATLTDVAELDVPTARRTLPLVLALVLVLLLGGGAAFWFLVLSGDEAQEAEVEVVEGEIVTLEPLTTTLGEAGLRHARIGMAVVLAEGQDPLVVAPKEALLKDALLREVALLDADVLRSSEGSAMLREQLSAEARDILGEEVVVRVVLTELLIQ